MQRIAGRKPRPVGDDGAHRPFHHRTAPRLPALEHRVEQRRSTSGGEQLPAETDHAAARYAVFEARPSEPVIVHFAHASAAAAEALGDDPDELVGHVDDHLFHGFAYRAVDGFRDDFGIAQLQFVTFAAHRFDEDGELQLAAAEHQECIGRVRVLYAD